jgi:hypothetical protein
VERVSGNIFIRRILEVKAMIEIDLKAAVLLARLKMQSDYIEGLLPFGIAWAQGLEDEVLATGYPLPESWLLVAKYVGVKHPERIRMRIYEDLPLPPEPEGLAKEFVTWGMTVEQSERDPWKAFNDLLKPLAQTTGYGIGIAARVLRAFYGFTYRETLCHEMVHVGQFERSGSLANFYTMVARNALQYGYANSPVELEAHRLGKTAAIRWCEITGEVERQTKISKEKVPEWRKRLEDKFAKRA